MMQRQRLTITICALALMAAAVPALAQGRGDRHRRGPGGMDGHRLEHLAQRLELSDAQREELKEAFASRLEVGAEARRAIFEARRALEAQIHADAFDEQAIRDAARELAALEADAAVERARRAEQMRQILTPEQFAELEEMREDRKQSGRRGPRGRRGGEFGGRRGLGSPPPVGE
jgi:Spy/CpxP family protein refolding chaperone